MRPGHPRPLQTLTAMPTFFALHPWDIDPHKWRACLHRAEAVMLSAGWSRHARKFHEVRMRKARQLWTKP